MASFVADEYVASVIGQDKQPIDPNSLKGKVIGLYFSAHWCGPCRGFTPKLVEKYNQIIQAGHPFEIIFVSADESEEDALGYFGSMPWLMIDFNNRDLEGSLSRKYEVRGIPSLILLDENGEIITKDGREAIMESEFSQWKTFAAEKAEKEKRFQLEVEEVKKGFNPVKFFASHKLIGKDNSEVSADSLAGKVVGLYFSAHWCPPCRGFTPVLAEKYKSFIDNGEPFEIIFVSSDRDAASAAEYFGEMPWIMLDFNDRATKMLLGAAFEVSGIPTLVITNESGVITDEGREMMGSVDSVAKILSWKEDKAAEEAKLAEEIGAMPDEVTLTDIHEHPLQKLPTVYRGSYGCDACGTGGKGWVYHCDECGFDVHPACVKKALAAQN